MRATLWSVIVCALASCSEAPSPTFSLVVDHEPAALLSVWGASPTDVWAVGGSSTAGAGPVVHHLSKGTWSTLDTGQLGLDLWWVYGFANGDVFLSGSGGTVLRYRDGAFEKMKTPPSLGIVFGMWGPAPDDVWAVGRAGTQGGAILWHFDGMVWSEMQPPLGFPTGALAFKVNGQRSDDVWIACSQGATLHWNGTGFEYLQTRDAASLFSIVTTPTDVIAAGDVTQAGAGALYENSGSGWLPAALATPVAWRGLSAGSGGEVYVVGAYGVMAQRDRAGAWSVVRQTLTNQSFHASWVDPEGGFWGVGGEFDLTPTREGFLIYRGTGTIPALN